MQRAVLLFCLFGRALHAMMEGTIAVVGGGPSGALAAERLASRGLKVVLFDEKLAWEKPCGGGLTFKALRQFPFLANAAHESDSVEHSDIENCELISPAGKRLRFRMRHPVAIVPRLALNRFLLQRARNAGADVRHERVTRVSGTAGNWLLSSTGGEYHASYLVLAAGARNSFRAQFLAPIAPDDLMATAGYFIPVRSSLMQIQFLKDISGYIWVFPRPDHVSAGITGKMTEISTRELRRMLEQWLPENGFDLRGASFYSHILPSLRKRSLKQLEACGQGWAMIGDSAGLVDPITGEGLYYALRSAELCAEALLAHAPEQYKARLEEEILPELRLAARASARFYKGQVLGKSVLELMIGLAAHSRSLREVLGDLIAGIQGYRGLKKRLHRILPEVLLETLAGKLRFRRSGQPALAADLFTDSREVI